MFEQCSSDYSPTSELTRTFYAFIQNKLHFAVSGNTAAEIIFTRADSEKPTMGLTTWKGAPDKKILRSDTHISEHIKNTFEEGELDENSVVRKFRTVQLEVERRVAREVAHYNLDMIISLGYRVKSRVVTHFRKWAET